MDPITEIKEIILGLKMSGLSFLEGGASDEIKAMIKALPSSEKIDKMSEQPKSIKNLQQDVGNILRLLELYGKRDLEFKTRYKDRTGLPPRYKVLDWRKPMQATKLAKEMIKVSSIADDKGKVVIASNLIKFAKAIEKDEDIDINIVLAEIKESGLEKEAEELVKEAQAWQQFKGFMGGALGKVKDIAKDVWQAGKAGGLEAKFNAIYKQLVDFKTQIDNLKNNPSVSPDIKQRMANLSQAIELGGTQIQNAAKNVKDVVSTPEPTTATPTTGQSSTVDVNQAITTLQGIQNMDPSNKNIGNTINQIINYLKNPKAQPMPITTTAPMTQASNKFNLKLHKMA